MSLSLQAIESVVSDQASLSAARKIRPGDWPLLGREEARQLVWGECQGSGSAPYRISVDLNDLGAKCSCPSRKFPCKHAVALMLAALDRPAAFANGTAPDWVNDWLSRRRPGATAKPADRKEGAAPVSLAAADEVESRDPQAEARAAARRASLKAQREDSVLSGLDELDRWIADQMEKGLASFAQRAPQQCRLAAQRMVDAKAPALATQLDALPAEILALPEAERATFALEALGRLHLLANAYRRQDRLPGDLRSDVRRLVGWTIERQELLEDAQALRVQSTWMVVATHAEVQPDRLRRIETWLMNRDLRFAVLIDFVPVVAGKGGSAFVPGEAFEAEIAFYPSAAPLRGLIVSRGAAAAFEWPAAQNTLGAALEDYDTRVAGLPWLSAWPVVVGAAQIAGLEDGRLWLSDETECVPLARRQQDEALALTAVDLARVAGLWDGRSFTALAAQTSLGGWHRAP
ncbi:MAG TPA: SWIM zinc finger family protein [Rhizomicrobium sp.]|nr:SWIM zinc finger family protein [Rhizomicrobium sp.]